MLPSRRGTRVPVWWWIAATLASACAPGSGANADRDAPPPIRPSAMEAHVRYLASDLLEGREAGTRGYDLAAAYVASQFQQLGLDPGGTSGSYLQPVPLQATWLVKNGARMSVRPNAGRGTGLVLGRTTSRGRRRSTSRAV